MFHLGAKFKAAFTSNPSSSGTVAQGAQSARPASSSTATAAKIAKPPVPSKQVEKKEPTTKKKEAKSDSSSTSSDHSVGNIFPQSLTGNHDPATEDTRSLFLKISYLERENKALTQKINDLQQGKAIDKELLDTVLNRIDDSVAEETNDTRTIVVLQKKISQLESNVVSLEKYRDSLHAQLLIQEQV